MEESTTFQELDLIIARPLGHNYCFLRSCKEWRQKRLTVKMLESLNSSSLSMRGLEDAYAECKNSGSHLTVVLLADILFKIIKSDLEDFCFEMDGAIWKLSAEGSQVNVERGIKIQNLRREKDEDAYVGSIIDWVYCVIESPPIGVPMLKRFLEIAYILASAYKNPCNSQLGRGPDAILTWSELEVAASSFMAVGRPSIADALSIIHCFQKKPLLNCKGLSTIENANLTKFDKKWESFLNVYPVVNKLADPPLVLIEPIDSTVLSPRVEMVLQAITTASNSPLPSGGAPPVQVNDVAGNFTNVFQLGTIDDARTFAAMLCVQMADATGGGGDGPALRILTLNAAPGAFRLY